jgi:hypothetical protein
MKQQLSINYLKPFYQQNGFSVQLYETILPTKWFQAETFTWARITTKLGTATSDYV